MTLPKPRPPLTPGETRAYPVLPLRDIVVFPHMIVPLFVGREKSIKALEEVMRSDTFILLATQKNASDDDPATNSIFEIGTLASVLQLLKLPDGTVKVLVEGAQRGKVLKYTDRSDYYEANAVVLEDVVGEKVEAEALARSVVTEFENYVKLNKKVSPEVVGVVQQIEDYAKLADTVASHLAVKIPDKQADPGDHVGRRAAGEGARPDGERNLRPAGREAHPHARQAPDGEDAARVLPQRADEGDPEGARRRGRQGRTRRTRGQDQEDQALEGSPREGDARAQEAAADVSDVGRGDGRAQLPRLAAVDPVEQEEQGQEGPQGRAGDPRRRSLRPGEGQGAHRRVSRRAAARQQADRADPVPGRASRRRQDLARQVDREGDRPRLRARVARRRARRGRDPRSPAHLHRLDARQGHPVDAQGEVVEPAVPAGRGRQDGRRFPRRSVVGAARGARPRAEPHVQRPLSRGRLRSVERDVHHHGEHAEHPCALDGPHGDHPDRRLHRGREGRDRAQAPDPERDRQARPQARGMVDRRRRAARC